MCPGGCGCAHCGELPAWAAASVARPSSRSAVVAGAVPDWVWFRGVQTSVLGPSSVQDQPDPAWHAREAIPRAPVRVVGSAHVVGSARPGGHAGPVYGGAAAHASGPVSQGGRYHAPNRVGQVLTSGNEVQALVASLDADFNTFATQVCGPSGARGVGCSPPEGIDQAFVARWTTLLEQWRNFRDETRTEFSLWSSPLAIFASPAGDGIRQYRADLVRLQADFSARTGEATIDPADIREGVIEQIAENAASGAGDFLADLAIPLGIGLVLIGLVVVSR